MTPSQSLTPQTLDQIAAGEVPSEIYSDHALHELEQERIFGHSWLFVGHVDMLPNRGDYITSRMGGDSVLVVRDPDADVRVFLNKCIHRGNKVCLFDRGNTKTFTCSYHGWSFDTGGRLIGVPGVAAAYVGQFDKTQKQLHEARVQTYGGLIFACWDEHAPSLEEYLGDMRWYLDTFVLMEDFGGLEVIPGKHRALVPINWKIIAEQFVGDHYHFKETHASALKVAAGIPNAALHQMRGETATTSFEVRIGASGSVPHSVGQLLIGEQYYEADLQEAEKLGPEAVDWVRERREYLQKRLADMPAAPYGFNRCHIFPNFSLIHATGGLVGQGWHLWLPRSAEETEVWEWCAVTRGAPDVVKEAQRVSIVTGHGIAGLIHPDDMENFSRIADNLQTPVAKKQTFDYTMGLGHEGRKHPAIAETEIADQFPGFLNYHTTEINQRAFLTYWAEQLLDAQEAAA